MRYLSVFLISLVGAVGVAMYGVENIVQQITKSDKTQISVLKSSVNMPSNRQTSTLRNPRKRKEAPKSLPSQLAIHESQQAVEKSPPGNDTPPQSRPQLQPQSKPPVNSTPVHIPVYPHLRPSASNCSFLCQYRLTRLIDPTPVLGQKPVHYPHRAVSPRYQAAGKTYHDYMTLARRMIEERETKQPHSLWGRRPNLTFNSNKKILAIGNSHLRQIMASFEWQYTEQTQNVYTIQSALPPQGKNVSFAAVETFVDPNHHPNRTTTIYICHNYAGVYSARWKQNVEEDILGFPLEELDAVVYGSFNRYNPNNPIHANSDLWKNMGAYGKGRPELEIDIVQYKQALLFPDLVQAYPGPIITMTSFRTDEQYMIRKNNDYIRDHTANRTHLVVNARDPITAIGGGECGHENKGKVAICHPNITSGHRGVGCKGGIPDLVAWDLLETLHELFD